MSLEERIERLERTKRRYRRMFTLLGAIAVCAVGISATHDGGVPDVIRAKEFEVVDDEGNVLVRLTDVGGAGALSIIDKTGGTLAGMVGITADGKRAGSVFTYRDGRPLVTLSTNPTGFGSIATFNNEGKPIVFINATAGGEGTIRTLGRNGKPVVGLGATEDGEGMVMTWNGNGKTLVQLGVTVRGEGTVTTWNGNGKTLVELGSVVGGSGAVRTWNDQGQELVRIGMMVEGNGGSLVVFNMTGERVCTLRVDEYGNGVIGVWDRKGAVRTLKPGP